jgi:hypothetical protein
VVGDTVYRAQVTEAKGNFTAPMSAEAMHRKLQDCLAFGGFDSAGAEPFEATIAGLRNSCDVAADLRQLSSRLAAKRAARQGD